MTGRNQIWSAAAAGVSLFLALSWTLWAAQPGGPEFPGWSTVAAPSPVEFHFSCVGKIPNETEALLRRLAPLPLMAQLRGIDIHVNGFPQARDEERYGGDKWLQPEEFFRAGGDCEDFAIAKYCLLRRLGVAASRLFIVGLEETVDRLRHAVLVVFVDQRALVLDAAPGLGIAPLDMLGEDRPIFSINELGSWRHELQGGR